MAHRAPDYAQTVLGRYPIRCVVLTSCASAGSKCPRNSGILPPAVAEDDVTGTGE